MFSICAAFNYKISLEKLGTKEWDIWAIAAMLLAIYLFEKKTLQFYWLSLLQPSFSPYVTYIDILRNKPLLSDLVRCLGSNKPAICFDKL